LVEKDLTQYNQLLNKTMQNFRKTQGKEVDSNLPAANKTFNDQAFRDKGEESKPIMATPSVKDITPLLEPSSVLDNEFY
jgi:hypothetical protein